MYVVNILSVFDSFKNPEKYQFGKIWADDDNL